MRAILKARRRLSVQQRPHALCVQRQRELGKVPYYEPNPGDIIFFDWASDGLDGSGDHVGIVEKCEYGIVYTIEDNSGDRCLQVNTPWTTTRSAATASWRIEQRKPTDYPGKTTCTMEMAR